MTLDTAAVAPWLAAALVALVGFAAFEMVRRRFAQGLGHGAGRDRGDHDVQGAVMTTAPPAVELKAPAQVASARPRSSAAAISRSRRRAHRHHRPERRRQVDAVQSHQRPLRPDQRRDPAERRSASTACCRTRSTGSAWRAASRSPTSSRRLSVFENLRCGLLWALGYRYAFWQFLAEPARRQRARRRAAGDDRPREEARHAGDEPHLCRAARAGDRHHHRRRRRRDPARRADGGHEQERDARASSS